MAKIVVLDDQVDICLSIKLRLIEDGHEVRISVVGDKAIDFGYLFKPDILITDWRLESEYDGLEVAEAFRFANQNIKTILMTGYCVDEVSAQSADLDIFKTISKPFSLEEISQIVAKAVDQDTVRGGHPSDRRLTVPSCLNN
jgi:DNA-binding NtrC family response regulator